MRGCLLYSNLFFSGVSLESVFGILLFQTRLLSMEDGVRIHHMVLAIETAEEALNGKAELVLILRKFRRLFVYYCGYLFILFFNFSSLNSSLYVPVEF